MKNKPDEEMLLMSYRRMKRIREFETRISKEFAAGTVPGMTFIYILGRKLWRPGFLRNFNRA